MAKPRTARQKAALRKAQLASARKRRKGAKTITHRSDSRGRNRPNTGKYTNTYTIMPASKTRRQRVKSVTKAAAVVGGIAAGYYGAKALDRYSRRKNYKAPKSSRSATTMRAHQPYSGSHNKTASTRKSNGSSDFNKRYQAAVSHRQSQAAEHRRRRTNARYARVSQKVADRGMYMSGLNSNVGGRTFVATTRGVSHRR